MGLTASIPLVEFPFPPSYPPPPFPELKPESTIDECVDSFVLVDGTPIPNTVCWASCRGVQPT